MSTSSSPMILQDITFLQENYQLVIELEQFILLINVHKYITGGLHVF